MRGQRAREYGALAGLLWGAAAWSANWLLTPMAHPDASSARQAAVVGQLVVMLAAGLLCWRIAGHATRAGVAPQ